MSKKTAVAASEDAAGFDERLSRLYARLQGDPVATRGATMWFSRLVEVDPSTVSRWNRGYAKGPVLLLLDSLEALVDARDLLAVMESAKAKMSEVTVMLAQLQSVRETISTLTESVEADSMRSAQAEVDAVTNLVARLEQTVRAADADG